MRNKTAKVSIFGAVLIALIFYTSMTVSAVYLHYADAGYMITECDDITSSARAVAHDQTVDVTVQGEVGPDLQINASCYAWDNSSLMFSTGSKHVFNLSVEYAGSYRYDEWFTYLDPQTSATHTLTILYQDVRPGQVYNTTLYCIVQDRDNINNWDDDTDYGTITLI
jgi:hypothetical protein